MSEWGPWTEHDGKERPVPDGVFVEVEERDGEIDAAQAEEFYWHWTDPNDEAYSWDGDIIRYRIRKPRGLTILEELLADLPAPSAPKVDA